MKLFIFLFSALIITACSHRNAISLDDRMEKCKVGYEMALRSGIDSLTENVIYQIALKKMHGYLEDTEQLELELSQLIMVSDNKSTRKKAELALRLLTTLNNFEIAQIRMKYNNEKKLFQSLDKYFSDQTPKFTKVK